MNHKRLHRRQLLFYLVLGGILVLAAVNHQVAGAFWLLVVYGIRAGLPLLAIAYGGRVLSQRILYLRSHSPTLQR